MTSGPMLQLPEVIVVAKRVAYMVARGAAGGQAPSASAKR